MDRPPKNYSAARLIDRFAPSVSLLDDDDGTERLPAADGSDPAS
jgi:hypothetical protein